VTPGFVVVLAVDVVPTPPVVVGPVVRKIDAIIKTQHHSSILSFDILIHMNYV
jgi:phosphotransferase system IIA component